jgi:hypothetical protein
MHGLQLVGTLPMGSQRGPSSYFLIKADERCFHASYACSLPYAGMGSKYSWSSRVRVNGYTRPDMVTIKILGHTDGPIQWMP